MFFGIADLDEAEFITVVIPVRFFIPVVHQSDVFLHFSFPAVTRKAVVKNAKKTLKSVKPRVFNGVIIVVPALCI